MKTRSGVMIAVLLTALTTAALAQQAKPEPAPSQTESKPIQERIIKELQFDGVLLDDAMDYLRDLVPGLNPVVVREPGVPKELPKISFRAKNITVGQFFEFLANSVEGLEVNPIEGPTGVVYVVKVHAPNTMPMGMPGGMAMGVDPATGLPVEATPYVRVYRLNEIISSLMTGQPDDKSETREKVLNDVLSLVQAAIEQVDAPGDIVLRVHEQTQTLMFKGPPAKHQVLDQTLATLQPTVDQTAKREADKLKAEIQFLQQKLEMAEIASKQAIDARRSREAEAADQIHDLQSRVTQLTVDNEVLKQKLAAAQKTDAPKP